MTKLMFHQRSVCLKDHIAQITFIFTELLVDGGHVSAHRATSQLLPTNFTFFEGALQRVKQSNVFS